MKVMDIRAGDNKYLHRDFHVSGDIGIAYVGEHYGDAAVDEYLRTFARSYYKPLAEKVIAEGLSALEARIREIYAVEEAPDAIDTELYADRLAVTVRYCPAVRFMRASGHSPSRWYVETTRTVYDELAVMAGLRFAFENYDTETGAAQYTFWRDAQ